MSKQINAAEIAHPVHTTTIRHAFDNIIVKDSANTPVGHSIGAKIYDALQTKAGVYTPKDNYRLSHRTYTKLKAEGVLA